MSSMGKGEAEPRNCHVSFLNIFYRSSCLRTNFYWRRPISDWSKVIQDWCKLILASYWMNQVLCLLQNLYGQYLLNERSWFKGIACPMFYLGSLQIESVDNSKSFWITSSLVFQAKSYDLVKRLSTAVTRVLNYLNPKEGFICWLNGRLTRFGCFDIIKLSE